jgi:hypothetical protein
VGKSKNNQHVAAKPDLHEQVQAAASAAAEVESGAVKSKTVKSKGKGKARDADKHQPLQESKSKDPAKRKAKLKAKSQAKDRLKVKVKDKVKDKSKLKAAAIASDFSPPAEASAKSSKLVRDSFTMPAEDFALIAQLKERALEFQRPTKKSELLRAGLQILAGLEKSDLQAALEQLRSIKVGRPKNAR